VADYLDDVEACLAAYKAARAQGDTQTMLVSALQATKAMGNLLGDANRDYRTTQLLESVWTDEGASHE
jgi:hypothetical protein